MKSILYSVTSAALHAESTIDLVHTGGSGPIVRIVDDTAPGAGTAFFQHFGLYAVLSETDQLSFGPVAATTASDFWISGEDLLV